MKEIIEKLKEYLLANQTEFHKHDMCGDTENGFYDNDAFDMHDLLKQIDKFSETFKP